MDQVPMQYAWDQVNLGSGFYKRKEYMYTHVTKLLRDQATNGLTCYHTYCTALLHDFNDLASPWYSMPICSRYPGLIQALSVLPLPAPAHQPGQKPAGNHHNHSLQHNPVQTGLNLAQSSSDRIEPCRI